MHTAAQFALADTGEEKYFEETEGGFMKILQFLTIICLAAAFFCGCSISDSGPALPDLSEYVSSTSITFYGVINPWDNFEILYSDEIIIGFNRIKQSVENTEVSSTLPAGTSTFTATKDDGSGPYTCWVDGSTATTGSLVTVDGTNPGGITIQDVGETPGTALFVFTITANASTQISDCVWNISPDSNADMQYARTIPRVRIAYPTRIVSGETGVNLDASASAPLYEGVITSAPSIASYAWTQTAGPAVVLSGENTAVCTFDAPAVAADTDIDFQVAVTDDAGLMAVGTITVTVTP